MLLSMVPRLEFTGGEDQSYFVDPHMQVRVLPVALRSQISCGAEDGRCLMAEQRNQQKC
jgi:hypothetical protein